VGARAEVSTDDVRAIVTPGKHAKAFALGDALGDRQLPRLLARLDEELWAAKTDRQKSAIGLCSGLISKVRSLLFARELLDADMIRPANAYPQFKSQLDTLPAGEFPDDRRISPLGLHPYVLHQRRTRPRARSFNASQPQTRFQFAGRLIYFAIHPHPNRRAP
jgi:hypothetical protein